MARIYSVSADTAEKEKIIGGILTLTQGAWCALGLLIGGGLFFFWAKLIHPIAGVFLGIPVGLVFIYFFAFFKKMDLPFLTYLIYRRDMNKKTHFLVNDLNYGKKNPIPDFFK